MIGIVDYDMGNIRSVLNALDYLSIPAKVIHYARDFASVDKIILPGVGAFGEGMEKLKEKEMLEELNREVLEERKPFLGICLGMQLICRESFEFGSFKGLNWINASVRRFEDKLNVRVPHVGWNNLLLKKKSRFIVDPEDGFSDVYFVHSYYVDGIDSEYVVATCAYGREFVAAVEKDNIFATQFHPEKSQKFGLEILRRFAAES